MEVITLSRKEISRYQVIKDSLDRKLSNNKAATLLGLSKRQIIRLKNKLRRDNLIGIIHGNLRRTPKIAIAKGHIESLSKTFQDRLHGISSIEYANEYLHNVFIPKFNKSFCRDPKDTEPAWRVVPGEINLDSVLRVEEQRTVMADNTISWRGWIFQVQPNKHRISFAKAKVVVEKRLDDSIHIRYKDQYLRFKGLSSNEPKNIKANTLPLPENLLTGDIFSLY